MIPGSLYVQVHMNRTQDTINQCNIKPNHLENSQTKFYYVNIIRKKNPAYEFICTMSWRRTSIESKVDLNAC